MIASGDGARRRWLITIAITILFGGFGAVMAYLSYANRPRPSHSTPSSPRGAPASSHEDERGKPDRGKPAKDH